MVDTRGRIGNCWSLSCECDWKGCIRLTTHKEDPTKGFKKSHASIALSSSYLRYWSPTDISIASIGFWEFDPQRIYFPGWKTRWVMWEIGNSYLTSKRKHDLNFTYLKGNLNWFAGEPEVKNRQVTSPNQQKCKLD